MTHLLLTPPVPVIWGPLDSLASFGSPELEMLNARFWMRCRRSTGRVVVQVILFVIFKEHVYGRQIIVGPSKKRAFTKHWKTTIKMKVWVQLCLSLRYLVGPGALGVSQGAQRPECGHCCRETWENGTGSLGVVWVVGIQQDVWHWIKSLSLF